ncbi:MAG TPA: SHOCT domain-containing protein [Streptosporangiaceae bacterium]
MRPIAGARGWNREGSVFGHKHEHEQEWTPTAGVVADSVMHHHKWSYVVDYRRADGATFRVTVPALPDQNIELRIGTQVMIEVDPASDAARLVAGQVLNAGGPAARDAIRAAAGDRGAAVFAALTGPGQPGVRIVGGSQVRIAGGPEVRVVGGAQAAEVMEAVQELMSGGDPAAARERMRHLKADLQAQAGPAPAADPVGFSSPEPSTFGRVAPPAAPAPTTFSSPPPAVGQAGPAFGQPGFSPVAPATTFSSPENPASFSAGSSFGAFGETRSDRIARLEDQRDRGQITPEQFAAQRQQLENEF